MGGQFDHERLTAYQKTLVFIAWAGPIIDNLPAKLAARDQLDRASTSIALNLAEGNGKRSYPDRCRFFDIARGSALECAACLDVLVARKVLPCEAIIPGKAVLLEVVSMIAGLIGRFSTSEGEQEPYNEQAGMPCDLEARPKPEPEKEKD